MEGTEHDDLVRRLEDMLTRLGLRCWAICGFTAEGVEVRCTRTPTELDFRAVNDSYRDWYEQTYETDTEEFEATWMEDEE